MKSLLKKVLTKETQNKIKNSIFEIYLLAIIFIQKNSFLSSFYYILFGDFFREQRAVLQGRIAYYNSLKRVGKSSSLLRRNIHRIEKGLIMKPRRSTFGEGFIAETISCYTKGIIEGQLDKNEAKWATDVLDEYFQVVGKTPIVEREHLNYKKARYVSGDSDEFFSILKGSGAGFRPFRYDELPEAGVSYEALRMLFIKRRSVRWYQEIPVHRELIAKAIDAAVFSPSACNRQPYRFLFCNNKSKSVEIAKCVGGTAGFAENLQSIVVLVGDLSAYASEKDRHLIYIDGSLVTMQFLLALQTLGLSTCCINWPDVQFNEKRLRKLVSLMEYERVLMLIAVGYADECGGIPYSQKKSSTLVLQDIS